MGLRALVFFILLVLLMNPLFRSKTVNYIKSDVAVLLDNSRSVGVEKGRYEGEKTYQNVLEQLNFDDQARISLSFFAFDEQLSSVRPDTLDFDGAETNLYAPLDYLQRNQEGTKAALLITDGIYTAGQDPAFMSRDLGVPLYVIGLGDTVSVRDLVVKNVVSNQKGYTQTEHKVEATIINDGYKGENVTVRLQSGDRVIARQNFTPTNQKSAHTLSFQIPLQKPGLHQYTIEVPEKASEWTGANNQKAFSIDVRDNRDRVLHLAFEIHPDVKSMRSILATDKNVSLTPRTWMRGEKFIEGDLPTETDSIDLVILHGYPAPDISNVLHQQLETLVRDVPVVFVRSPQQDLNDLPSSLESYMPISTTSSSVSPLSSGFYPVEAQSEHAIMDLPEVAYSNLPSIYAPIRNVELSPSASALFKTTYQGSETEVPFVAVQQLGNKRSAIINGYGFYRLRQHHAASSRSFITRLISNIIAWNAADTDDKLLRVIPAQQVFDGDDKVQFNVFLRNESGEQESNASIDLRLQNEAIGAKQFTMTSEGNGQYSLNIGTLGEGIYQFEATARKGETTIDRYQGEFSVSPTRIEYVNTTRNDNLLRQLAENSGGRFFDFSQIDSIWHHMSNAGLMDETKHIETQQYYPYQHLFWFFAVVLLLGMEWLLRKYFALP